MSKRVSKILLGTPQGYLLSRKRAPRHPHKDGLLELLGGGADGGEGPLEALRRELREEEPSGELVRRVDERGLGEPAEITIDSDPHFVYRLELDEDGAHLLDLFTHDPQESYGLELVPRSVLEDRDQLALLLGRFTPRTRLIFAALRLV